MRENLSFKSTLNIVPMLLIARKNVQNAHSQIHERNSSICENIRPVTFLLVSLTTPAISVI